MADFYGADLSFIPTASFLNQSLIEAEIPPCRAVTAIGEGLGYIAPEDPGAALPDLLSRRSS